MTRRFTRSVCTAICCLCLGPIQARWNDGRFVSFRFFFFGKTLSYAERSSDYPTCKSLEGLEWPQTAQLRRMIRDDYGRKGLILQRFATPPYYEQKQP